MKKIIVVAGARPNFMKIAPLMHALAGHKEIETVLVHTGIAMEIPEGLVGLVYARSGLASKRNLAPANKVGVIDSDYRGEIMVALHNHGEAAQEIMSGERIAQLVDRKSVV